MISSVFTSYAQNEGNDIAADFNEHGIVNTYNFLINRFLRPAAYLHVPGILVPVRRSWVEVQVIAFRLPFSGWFAQKSSLTYHRRAPRRSLRLDGIRCR